jgi:hypothetical protein
MCLAVEEHVGNVTSGVDVEEDALNGSSPTVRAGGELSLLGPVQNRTNQSFLFCLLVFLCVGHCVGNLRGKVEKLMIDFGEQL